MREDEDSRRDSGGYFRKCSSMRSIDSKIGGGETSLQSNEKGRNGPPLSLLTNKKESNQKWKSGSIISDYASQGSITTENPYKHKISIEKRLSVQGDSSALMIPSSGCEPQRSQ